MIITVDRPNLLAALAFRNVNEVRTQMRGLIFDMNGSLVGTDGYCMFVGKHGGVEQDAVIEFRHKPPAKFEKCEVNTETGVARYLQTSGMVAEGEIWVSDRPKLQWERAVNLNWSAPKPDCGATTTRINANLVQKACKALAQFRKDGQIYIMPSDNALQGVKFILDEGPFVLVMSMRLPGPKKS
ncbi:hypothetical protein MWH03_00360 [Klebsiella pneumoniae]|nr:hypothetical protein [Klebsiella pneumoniae]